MDKNQTTQLVIGYLNHYLPEAEKALVEVEKITDLQKKYDLANSAHSKHSYYSTHANGLCSKHGLSINGVSDYTRVVDKLYNIKNETEKKLSASRCARCKKMGIIPYKEINSWSNEYGYKTVFCSQICFDEYNKFTCEQCQQTKSGQYWENKVAKKGKISPIAKGPTKKFCSQQCLSLWNQNNLSAQNNADSSETICRQCNNFFSGQYWYKNNLRESITHKFCSQECCDTCWNKKQCAGCSTLLTSEEICYCSACLKKNDEAIKNLQNSSQDINKDMDDFNRGVDDYINNQRNNNDNKSSNNSDTNNNNPRERERERERESNLTQQSQLRSQITSLESNSQRTPVQEQELEEKKRKLQELEDKLKELERKNNPSTEIKPKSDKTALYVGCGVVGVFALLLILILVRNRQSKKRNKY